MLSIRIPPTNTAGILYPSLCPTGYDPVLEYDIRMASAVVAATSYRHEGSSSSRGRQSRAEPKPRRNEIRGRRRSRAGPLGGCESIGEDPRFGVVDTVIGF
jgi:hypothetical protein